MNYVIQVNGIPFKLELDGDGEYIVQAVQQNVEAGGSPTVVTFDPPIGPITSVNLGDVYQAILAAIGG